MEIRFLVDIDENERSGVFNAVIERVTCVEQPTVYNLSLVDTPIVAAMKSLAGLPRKGPKRPMQFNGVHYQPIVVPAGLLHYAAKKIGWLLPLVFSRHASRVLDAIGGDGFALSAHWGKTAGLIAHFVSEKSEIPYFVTYHGSDINNLPPSRRRLRELIVRSLESATTNIFVSHKLLESARELGFRQDNAIVIHNGVDSAKYSARTEVAVAEHDQAGSTASSPVVGFVGNMRPIKGADRLPAICAAILDLKPEARFVFAGDGDCLPRIRSEMSDVDVTLLGHIDADAVPGLMRSFDALVIPSRNEGLPLVLLEALASGVPVIASRVGGIPEVLAERYLVEQGDDFTRRFALAVASVLDSPPEIQLDAMFDWENIRRKERRLYISAF